MCAVVFEVEEEDDVCMCVREKKVTNYQTHRSIHVLIHKFAISAFKSSQSDGSGSSAKNSQEAQLFKVI